MNISKTFIQVTATALTLEASVFLIRSNIILTPESIVKISVSRAGHNTDIVTSLAQQSADSKVGLMLLLLSFLFMLWQNIRPDYLADAGDPDMSGCAAAVFMSLIIFLAAYGSSKYLYLNHMRQVDAILSNILVQ